jgi:hypothetical protein
MRFPIWLNTRADGADLVHTQVGGDDEVAQEGREAV